MKINITIFLITFLAIACSKENNFKNEVSDQNDNAVAVSAIPINDLGTGTFRGDTGGLYPHGLNYPTGTYATDLMKTCNNVRPLDTFGNPTTDKTGKIVFISLGWSTGGKI
jgi:hypothetical protein